jgi:AraC family transcriptional regulator of arabinose operon
MYTNTGYMNLTDDELEDSSVPLKVNCCGVYRLITHPVMSTFYRQRSRRTHHTGRL